MTVMELPSARPYAYKFELETTALLIIDMQRDFVEPQGFGMDENASNAPAIPSGMLTPFQAGMIQCNNDELFQKVRKIIPRTRQVLEAARGLGMHVIHTREGHKSSAAKDLPASKRLRQISSPSGHHTKTIGDQGPMGKLLIRGEYGHDIIEELKPIPGEVVVDKPGKGSFWNTELHRALLARGITHLLFAGVTTECCVNTTAREAADRGFETCILADCTDGFYEPFYTSTLDMLCSYDGLFGFVGTSQEFLGQLPAQTQTPPATPPAFSGDISLKSLRTHYMAGNLRPSDIIKEVSSRIASYKEKDPAVWTFLHSDDELSRAAAAVEERFAGKPLPELYGVPFAVKDNIDVASIPTTVACEAYAYTPTENAKVVTALLEAGAILVGKTNLDQLATGLSGCRSPYGSPRSVFGDNRISGGSSSGSSVAIAAGLVTFALGTDTAGSGRVPAAYNGLIGFKPTRGTLSSKGLVPACKSLDTITILAPTVDESRRIWLVADQGPDIDDPYGKTQQSLPLWHADFRGIKQSTFTFGVPPRSALDECTEMYQKLFADAVERLQRAGGIAKDLDWTPFKGASDLLYDASLVQERVACLGAEFLATNLDKLHPATKELYAAALSKDVKPWEVFRDLHLQAKYTRDAAKIFEDVDVLLVPSTTCHPKIAEMEKDPLALNAKLGYFTHFGNGIIPISSLWPWCYLLTISFSIVLDLCAIAVPAATYQEADEVLPFGVTLLGAMGMDGKIFDIAREFERTA